MPGSKRFVAYFTDDAAEKYANLDESVAESTDLGFGVSVTPAVYADPCNWLRAGATFPLEMRYIRAERVDADGRVIRRQFFVGATSAPCWGANINTCTVDGETWAITAKVGEVRHYPPATDTGQIDGDVDTIATPNP